MSGDQGHVGEAGHGFWLGRDGVETRCSGVIQSACEARSQTEKRVNLAGGREVGELARVLSSEKRISTYKILKMKLWLSRAGTALESIKGVGS